MLLELARGTDGPGRAPRRRDIEALCRKVHVARRVDDRYTREWRRARSGEPLPAGWWPLLVAVLLADAEEPLGAGDERHGLALKSLNAALAALDLAPPPPPGAPIDELRRRAQALLGTLAAGGGS